MSKPDCALCSNPNCDRGDLCCKASISTQLERDITHLIQAASADDNTITHPEPYVNKLIALISTILTKVIKEAKPIKHKADSGKWNANCEYNQALDDYEQSLRATATRLLGLK